MASVTVLGSNNSLINLTFDSSANFALAERIAARISLGVSAGLIRTESDANGPPPVLPATISGAYLQASTGVVSLPTNYTTDLITKAGSAIVFGSGAPNEMILSSINTNLTFIAAAGSGSVVAGGGNDRLMVGGAGNWDLNTADGDDIIAATGSGKATIAAGGGHNAILLGSGHDLIIAHGDDTISGGSGAETVDASGAHSVFVTGNASHLLFVGGLGGATILGGSGSDTYFGSGTGQTGAQFVVGGADGNNYLFAGDGAATLVGGGNNDQLFAYGNSGQLLIAGAGNETLSAALSAGNNTLVGGSGQDLMIGGWGNDTFVGGSGQSTVTGGFGKDVYAFINHHAGGTELINGVFDPSAIEISLKGYASTEVAHALAHQTVTGGSVSIGLTDGTKITFQDVTALHTSNFI